MQHGVVTCRGRDVRQLEGGLLLGARTGGSCGEGGDIANGESMQANVSADMCITYMRTCVHTDLVYSSVRHHPARTLLCRRRPRHPQPGLMHRRLTPSGSLHGLVARPLARLSGASQIRMTEQDTRDP